MSVSFLSQVGETAQKFVHAGKGRIAPVAIAVALIPTAFFAHVLAPRVANSNPTPITRMPVAMSAPANSVPAYAL